MPTILSPEDGVADNAERFVSMSVTRNADAVIQDNKLARNTRAVNVVDDIQGARPRSLPPYQRNNFYDNSDIEGAKPRQLHRERRSGDPNVVTMSTVIPGSVPTSVGFETRTKRRTNPLEPVYNLPSVEAAPAPEVPFKRDLYNIDDIAGTKPRAYLPWSTRETVSVDDIPGTHSAARTFSRTMTHLDHMQVRDINEDGIFRSQRRVDPLRPAHSLHGRVITDDDRGMFPKQRTKDGRRPFLSLTTADIEGAQTCFQQEVPVGNIQPENRRHYRVTNYIDDLPGAHAGTVKRGLTNARMTNPVERDYILLEGRTLSPEELAVGKSWYNAAATVLQAEAAEAASTMPLGHTGVIQAVGPALSYSKRIVDPRDAELARLKGEVDTLRKEKEILSLTSQLQATAPAGQAGSHRLSQSSKPFEGAAGQLTYRRSQVVQPAPSQPLDISPAYTATIDAHLAHSSTRALQAVGHEEASAASAPPSAGAGAGSDENAYASHDAEASSPPLTSAIAQPGSYGYDPVASMRSTVAAAQAKNILGVIPAFPSATVKAAMGGSGGLRSSGRFDRTLESTALTSAEQHRGAQGKFDRPAPSQQMQPVVKTNHQAAVQRMVVREKAAEVAEVRGLPDLKRK